jgi:hypothetical protein
MKLRLLLACLLFPALLFAQGKDIDFAIKQGVTQNKYSLTPKKTIYQNDLPKWEREFEKRGYTISEKLYSHCFVFGQPSYCVSKIWFMDTFIKDAIDKIYEKDRGKWVMTKQAGILMAEARERYSYYTLLPELSDGSEIKIEIEAELRRYRWEFDALMRFIAAFPEYPFMLDVAWERNRPDDFLRATKNYAFAETKIYDQLQTAYSRGSTATLRWAYGYAEKTIPLLEGNIDISHISNLMKNCFKKDLSLCKDFTERIESYMCYTGNKYFSRNSVKDYYTSVADFKQLASELKKCTPLLQSYPDTENNLYQTYFSQRFKEGGVAESHRLIADFPDQKSQILSYARYHYIDKPFDSNSKWSKDIRSHINKIKTIREKLDTYINTNVPDNEGMQLARQHRSKCNEIISNCERAEMTAKAYESKLSSRIYEIQKAVLSTQIVPPYRVIKRKQYNEFTEWIDITVYSLNSFDLTVQYDYKTGVYYISGFGNLPISENIRSLNELVLKYVKDMIHVILWDSDNYLPKAERIIEQFNKYGIKEWYKIQW